MGKCPKFYIALRVYREFGNGKLVCLMDGNNKNKKKTHNNPHEKAHPKEWKYFAR